MAREWSAVVRSMDGAMTSQQIAGALVMAMWPQHEPGGRHRFDNGAIRNDPIPAPLGSDDFEVRCDMKT